jgi:signal transduction histidine kinase
MNFAEVVRQELAKTQKTTLDPYRRVVDTFLVNSGVEPRRSPALDPTTIRLMLLDALERYQSQEPAFGTEHEFSRWQDDDRAVRFAEHLYQGLRQSIGRTATASEMEEMIRVAIARRLSLGDTLSSIIKTMELDRLSENAWEQTGGIIDQWVDAAEYVIAIRAVVLQNHMPRLSAIGQVHLRLTGKDAIRWLLSVEATQSTGPNDDWRVSRDTASTLLRMKRREFAWDSEDESWPHSWKTLRRLAAFDLLAIDSIDTHEVTVVQVLPLGFELLPEIAKEAETAMSVLAVTLSQDLTAEATQVAGLPGPIAVRNKGADAATRQARLVAHEIRNALVPVRVALDALYRDVSLERPDEVVTRNRPVLDGGIHRALSFVDQLLSLATLSSSPPEKVGLQSVLRDAFEQIAGLKSTSSVDHSLPAILGNRSRILLALTNLLQNAKNAAVKPAATVHVSAAAESEGKVIVMNIDDDGPGVSPDKREEIFSEGYTTSPGGSGLGLALVREIFENEMGGKVTCEQSPLGGARFTIRLPVQPKVRS